MKPNFAKDLAAGQAGELAVQKLWPELELLHGKGADARLPNGELVEIKCDSYGHDKTANFFIEHVGDIDSGKLGGPWKAKADGCRWFVYYFSNPGIAYVFETETLLKDVDAYILQYNPKPVEIKNKRWTTLGYKMARSHFSPALVLRSGQK